MVRQRGLQLIEKEDKIEGRISGRLLRNLILLETYNHNKSLLIS